MPRPYALATADELRLTASDDRASSNGADGFEPVEITESGWYTFQHNFTNVDGKLVVVMSVSPKGGTSVHTWSLSDPSDTIGVDGTVGGNRYGWLVTHSFDSVAMDNITRISN